MLVYKIFSLTTNTAPALCFKSIVLFLSGWIFEACYLFSSLYLVFLYRCALASTLKDLVSSAPFPKW